MNFKILLTAVIWELKFFMWRPVQPWCVIQFSIIAVLTCYIPLQLPKTFYLQKWQYYLWIIKKKNNRNCYPFILGLVVCLWCEIGCLNLNPLYLWFVVWPQVFVSGNWKWKKVLVWHGFYNLNEAIALVMSLQACSNSAV